MAWSLIEQLENHPGLVSAKEIAKWTGWTKKTVYEKMKSNEIPVVQFGPGTESKKVDPMTWKYVLLKRDPMLAEAHRKSRG
jgi:hypothetical protein